MTDAQEILKLIENVAPEDENALDEIDARVCCYLKNKACVSYKRVPSFYNEERGYLVRAFTDSLGIMSIDLKFSYTRSRDVLKKIRPKGWFFTISSWLDEFECMCGIPAEHDFPVLCRSSNPYLPTEELAELHAIIQAIEYERTHEGESHA